ncbi:FAD-dependent monooxygenase [Geodermatophilus maliterrae]|uniref:FAD-dependent monooxygenase n=1 Tax=Geodermatophilus maliterrae TaxID=3162531 RepID=A0ABV3XHI2_9ACTN
MTGVPGSRTRRIAVIGGGPAGLFFARMVGLLCPGTAIDVYERRAPGQAPGFGVTLSARAMAGVAAADPDTHHRIVEAGRPLSGVEVRISGARLAYPGFGATSVSRAALLGLLADRAREVGARIHHRHVVGTGEDGPRIDAEADVVVLADGAASVHRAARAATFGTTVRTGHSRFVWLGTSADFGDVSSLVFQPTEYGPMAAHCYSHGPGASTVVVEMDDATWRNAGLHGAEVVDGSALDLLSEVFAEHLQGSPLVSHRSRWRRFEVVRNRRWHDGRSVLLGDAAHTAHFTVSSGTKLALEDAHALASAVAEHDDPRAAFRQYGARRHGPVARTQFLSETSMHWWETVRTRMHLPPEQFGMHFVTRSGAVGAQGLLRRFPDRVAEAEEEFLRRNAGTGQLADTPVAAPLRLGGTRFPSRLVRASAVRDGFLWLEDHGSTARARFGFLPSPEGPEWSADGDRLVLTARDIRDRGAAGVVIPAGQSWDETTRFASRIRHEAGLAVAVALPSEPGAHVVGAGEADLWSQVRLALIAGRIDLVAVPGAAAISS